ncbi:MAG: PAS domain S-box protein [Micrococcales bacterium]|nr:PAS domain S-box protein [Micrococcales bacterium]
MGGDRPRAGVRPAAAVPDLATAEEWCREAVERFPDGMLLVEDGVVIHVNATLETMSGWNRTDLVGHPLETLVPEAVRVRHTGLRRGYARAPRSRAMGEGLHLSLQRADGVLVPVEIALAPLVVAGRRMTIATVRDVTTRRAEEDQRARLALILDLVPDSVVVVHHATGRIEAVNRAATTLLGYPTEELRGMSTTELTPPDDVDRGPVLCTDGHDLHPQRLLTRAGEVVDCEVHASRLPGAEGEVLVNVVRDVRSRLALERRLRESEQAQQRLALLEERQRIARELHDTVIQDVIGVGMELSAEVDRATDHERQQRDLDRITRLEEVTRNLRRAIFELRGSARRGSAVREVTDLVAEASRVLGHVPSVTFAGALDGLPPELVDDVLAALREALSNTARHAGAARTEVSLTVTEDGVTLVVDDDGVGPAGVEHPGDGLGNLEERARRHGGTVEVGPSPQDGTRVRWACPLPAPTSG